MAVKNTIQGDLRTTQICFEKPINLMEVAEFLASKYHVEVYQSQNGDASVLVIENKKGK